MDTKPLNRSLHVAKASKQDEADVELFLKRNKAARIARKGDDKYPGGDFRSRVNLWRVLVKHF